MRLVMRILIVIAMTLVTATSAQAYDWPSQIDAKYRQADPDLFLRFERARSTLDAWRGERGRLTSAAEILFGIVELNPLHAPTHREIGRLYIMAGFSDSMAAPSENPAELSILRSIEIEPGYAEAYVLLGHLYTELERYEEADRALLKAEQIGTESPWLPLNRAELLSTQKEYQLAKTKFQAVVDIGTSNRKAYASALEGTRV